MSAARLQTRAGAPIRRTGHGPCTVPTATPPAAALERRRLRPAAAATVAPHGTARLIERSQPSYEDALRASLSRGSTLTTAQLVQQAFTEEGRTCTLQRQLGLWAVADSPAAHRAGGGPPLFDADEAASTWMEGWEASPQTLPGFDTEASLGVPGLADVAILSRGGRAGDCWKGSNQDAHLAATLGSDALLLGVFDGHGRGGELASQAAAAALAAAVPEARASLGAQPALVSAFQRAAASMRADGRYERCGAAGVACLVEPGSVTAAWAGDCRAVVGLSVEGPARPTVLVHALTQDHKPGSPLERARIEATARGAVTSAHSGGRLRGKFVMLDGRATLGLSRALGDVWAEPLGLTSEPDAVTIQLSDPVPGAVAPNGTTAAPASPLDSLVSGSCGTCDAGDALSPPARHVLLLGCDGLWDVMGNAEAVAIALSCPSAAEAAAQIMQAARRKWAAAYRGTHMDDITVMAAFLPC